MMLKKQIVLLSAFCLTGFLAVNTYAIDDQTRQTITQNLLIQNPSPLLQNPTIHALAFNAIAQAIEELSNLPFPDENQRLQAINQLQQGDSSAAIAIYQRLFDQRQTEGGKSQDEAAMMAKHLASFQLLTDLNQGLATYEQAAKLSNNARWWNELGSLYMANAQLDKAEQAFNQVLALPNGSVDNNALAVATGSLGHLYWQQGDFKRAEPQFLRSLEINETLNRQAGILLQYKNLSTLYAKTKEWRKAIPLYEKLIEHYRSTDAQRELAEQYSDLAMAYLHLEDFFTAESQFLKSIEIYQTLADKAHTAAQYRRISGLYEMQGKKAEADEARRKSLALENP
ncbi:hypothetical protein BegalDRAFT_1362 [Beggiatoa alba B18LD]|uniref:Uncharacterized protein n=1 Tax=Beggiatoa alba B18LD TaxID=395493 RepID=I3CF64_9GAMM|nr:tetratricopeptide repeat protein [Beggiatoa alba]EIJ42257.1 hypothetical protein BegalDRAFT_1362 [Beggiatoa alba B18LD]